MGGNSRSFAKVAVLGPGLLGGSIAKAVHTRLSGCELRLWARRPEPLALARSLGITAHTYLDLCEAVRGADLVILATPIGVFPQLVQGMLPALAPGAIVTDVGSVKGMVHDTAGAALTRAGHIFIGSHPMAGAEKQGLEHAREDLLLGATVAITNPHHAPAAQVERLAAFWRALGGCTCEMTPALHDCAVARISHMPHILAALCARNAGGERMDYLRLLASSGFRDTTRVSSGGVSMWADILQENSVSICQLIDACIADMQSLAELLRTRNKPALADWLEHAKETREDILAGEIHPQGD